MLIAAVRASRAKAVRRSDGDVEDRGHGVHARACRVLKLCGEVGLGHRGGLRGPVQAAHQDWCSGRRRTKINRRRQCFTAKISEKLKVKDNDKEDIFPIFTLLKTKK